MHSKQYGNLGEIAVAKDLISKGYYVFTELGDICKSDLIILNEDYKPIKLQVKCVSIKHGKISFSSVKSGPNYSYTYELKHADIYAIYILLLIPYIYCIFTFWWWLGCFFNMGYDDFAFSRCSAKLFPKPN